MRNFEPTSVYPEFDFTLTGERILSFDKSELPVEVTLEVTVKVTDPDTVDTVICYHGVRDDQMLGETVMTQFLDYGNTSIIYRSIIRNHTIDSAAPISTHYFFEVWANDSSGDFRTSGRQYFTFNVYDLNTEPLDTIPMFWGGVIIVFLIMAAVVIFPVNCVRNFRLGKR